MIVCRVRAAFLVLCACVLTPSVAVSQPGITLSPTAPAPTTLYTATTGTPQSFGWSFIPTVPVTVTALGHFDAGGDGLASGHQLGLFDPAGTALAVTSISAGTATPLVGDFRFVTLASSVTLAPGLRYTVAAYYTDQLDAVVDANPPPAPDLVVDTRIGSLIGKYEFPSPAFAFPSTFDSRVFVGANVLFAPVPEPSLLLLVVTPGLASWVVSKRGRRKNAEPDGVLSSGDF